jgi:DNA-binding MarR family transcriptional regulator
MNPLHPPLVPAIRKFNRFYSNMLGFFDQYITNSEFSSAEACVLREIDQMEDCTSKKLASELKMDSGYLSRIIKRLSKHNLVVRKRSEKDGRSYFLHLTDEGLESLTRLDELSLEQIGYLIAQMQEKNKKGLIEGMKMIEDALAGSLLLFKKRPKLAKQTER